MNGNGHLRKRSQSTRCSARVYSLREITISYEGKNEEIVVKPPNLSKRGMFINTSRIFPEGAVLNLRFYLVLTGAEIHTRCEVRYCQPGAGIGVEFIGLLPEYMKTIEREIALSESRTPSVRPGRRWKKSAARPQGKR